MGTGFIGRAAELRVLQEGLDDALLGRGGLFTIGGEPGIGKTRLAEEVATLAAGRGAEVVWGRCWEGGGAPAYWPWLQLIRAHVRACDRNVAAEQLGNGARDLVQILPELQEYVGSAAAVPLLDPDDAQFRLFDATLTLFKNVAARQPLVLIIDDLHAADPLSLRLLRFVAQELRMSAIIGIATYRETEVRQIPGVRDLVADVLRVSRGFVLRGLSPAEVRELIAQALQGAAASVALSDAVVAAIHGATDGNPFFIDAIVRASLIEGDLQGWGTAALERLRIPDQAGATLRQRLRLLPPAVVDVLRIGAVIGREFDARVVSSVQSGGTMDLLPTGARLLDHLSRAIEIGVIAEIAGIPGRYGFTHPLMRETVYGDISASQRIQLHRSIAEVLDADSGAPADERVERIAHHFYQAAAHGCARPALEYAVRAAERASTMLAYDDAVRHWEHAIEVLEIGGETAAGTLPVGVRRAELLLGLGNALNDSGDRARAKETLTRAAGAARDAGAPTLLARIALAFGGGWLGYAEMANMNEPVGTVPEASLGGLLSDALEALGETDDPVRARLLTLLARDGYFTMPMPEREALARQAIDAARRSRDLTALAEVLVETQIALWGPDSTHERLEMAREAMHLAQLTGQPYYESGARFQCVVNLLDIGTPDEFEREAAAFTRFAERTRLIGAVWTDKVRAAMQALFTGRYDDAEWAIGDALRAGKRADLGAQIAYNVQTVALRREQGRLDELSQMVPVWKMTVAQRPRVTALRAGLTFFYAETGQLAEARAELEHLARNGWTDLARDLAFLVSLTQLTEVCVALNDPTHCASLYALLRSFAHYNATEIFGAVCWGSVSRSLGLLATLMGHWDDARQHFETAIERNRAFGARPWVAHTQYAYARMLLRRGSSDDRARSVALLADALAAADVLKMMSLAERARALLLQAEGTEDRGHAAAGDDGRDVRGEPEEIGNRFHRSGDYWTVAYGGTTVRLKSNRGLQLLAALLRQPGREIAAAELAAGGDRTGDTDPSDRPHPSPVPSGREKDTDASARLGLGDAGEQLDAQARATYKQQLAELREELTEAEEFNDTGRSERLRGEIEFLAAELSRAVGIGGRERRAGSHAERARVNVTRAISLALAKVNESHPALGEHFARTIKTGTFCSYAPDPRAPIEWET